MDDKARTERHEVLFAGFRSDTWTLQSQGWDITVERDLYHMDGIRLLLRHEKANLHAVTNYVNDRMLARDFSRNGPMRMPGLSDYPPFVVQRVGPKEHWRLTEPISVSACMPIDARPQFIDIKEITWDELPIFAKVGVPEEKEIIVDPSEVQFYLDKILEAQAPRQKELREKARKETRQIHAQVVSLAA